MAKCIARVVVRLFPLLSKDEFPTRARRRPLGLRSRQTRVPASRKTATWIHAVSWKLSMPANFRRMPPRASRFWSNACARGEKFWYTCSVNGAVGDKLLGGTSGRAIEREKRLFTLRDNIVITRIVFPFLSCRTTDRLLGRLFPW